MEPWSLVCPFLNDKFYGPPFMTSFHFIWALFFLFPNKNGIDIGTKREWIIHMYLIFGTLFQRGYHGRGGFIGTLRRELGVLLKHRITDKTGKPWFQLCLRISAYLLPLLQLVPFPTVPSIDAVEGLSVGNFLICQGLEITSVNAAPRFMRTAEHRPQPSSAFYTLQHGPVISLRGMLQF